MRYFKAIGLTRANALFAVAFFGSFAILGHLDPKWDDPWLFISVGWAILIRWWMVAGLLLGLFLHPIQLHVIDLEGTLLYAASGAIAGFVAEGIWQELYAPIGTAPPASPDESGPTTGP